jgi:hypothetical protein
VLKLWAPGPGRVPQDGAHAARSAYRPRKDIAVGPRHSSPSGEHAYAADWHDFPAFCTRIGRERLPAETETTTLYLAELGRRERKAAVSTVLSIA